MDKVRLVQEGEDGRVHRLFVNGVDVSERTRRVYIVIEGGKAAEVHVFRRIDRDTEYIHFTADVELPEQFVAKVFSQLPSVGVDDDGKVKVEW